MLALGRDMAELSPSGWLLNYTNPMAMLCWLVYAGTPTTRVVGLCHSVQATTRDLAELVGVPVWAASRPSRASTRPSTCPGPCATTPSSSASASRSAIVTGEPAVIYGNVANAGLLPGLPEGCCVEVPCLVDRAGVHPVAVPEDPAHLAALNRTFVNVCELTVRAVLEGRPEYVRLAAMLDTNAGATLTLEEIDAVCAELTRAHGELLPASLRAPS